MDAYCLGLKGNAFAFQVGRGRSLGSDSGIWGDDNCFRSKVFRCRKCVKGRSFDGKGKERPVVSILTSDINKETMVFQAPMFARERAEPKNIASIILGGGTGAELFPLTSTRATAAVPIGGCYRLIDIPMSNCINSGLNKIFIMTQFNSASLNRHIARTYNFSNGVNFGDGFVEVLAATQTPGEAGMNWFQGTADAVRQFSWVFEDNRNKNIEHILILSGDHLYRMDYMDFVQKHIDAGADISVSCVPTDDSRASDCGLIKIDKTGHIVQFSEKPKGTDLECMKADTTVFRLSHKDAMKYPYIASMGIYVFRRDVLLKLLKWRFPTSNDFGSEILPSALQEYNVQVQQLDVANAFLHGTLAETIYMQQPKGFEDTTYPNHVCRLHKALYGLKQAPREWYNTFTTHLLSLGFNHSKSDPSLLTLRHNDTQIFLLIYVDDILITGNNNSTIMPIMYQLNQKFSMKHLGTVNSFLGIQISKSPNGYFLSQKPYASSLLQLSQLSRCNALANPNCTKLPADFKPDSMFSESTLFRKLIGSLQYLTITRPDIAYSVNLLSQYMHQPLQQHYYMLKRLLRYIKGTLDYGLPITRTNLQLKSFSDADWAGDPLSRKSTSGYCTFLGDTLISWTVKKQKTVSRSSTESEYRSLAALTADIIWLRRLLTDFGVLDLSPTEVYCDNTSAIALAHNPVFHARTKHIEIDQRFVRDHIHNKNINLLPISTVDQIADIFTKALSTSRFHILRRKLTVIQEPSACGGLLEYTSN